MSKKTRHSHDPEPTWGDNPSHSVVEAINWYNANKEDKDAAKYLGVDDISLAKRFTTLAWTRRMQSLGCVFDESLTRSIAAKEAEFVEAVNALSVSQQSATNVISIQERVNEKTYYFVMELEGKFDELWFEHSIEEFDAYAWMIENNVKPMHANKIAEYFRARAKGLVEMLEARKTDEFVRESYRRPPKEYISAINIFLGFVKDAERIATNASKARAPRKKKPVSVERKVRGLKFLDKFDELKLQSINPTKIPGSNQLWVYNVKTRKLGVYIALDAAGLDVKGSTILNYSFSASIGKTLRAPEKVLKIVTDGGKIALRKTLDSVNSKPKPLNGRINKDTILLRIV